MNYDAVAPAYDGRYAVNSLSGVARLLGALAREVGARAALEVGCGTGHWLLELRPMVPTIAGLDLSAGMLRQARQRAELRLVRGTAAELPFPSSAFDLVYCINALHHFPRPRDFVREARRLLRPGGALLVVGMDPHAGRDRWYVYDYFDGTRATDLARFPASGSLLDWAIGAGFERATWQVVEATRSTLVGRAVLADHFLQKHGTSQLTLLSDEAYAAGLARLHAALEQAEARGETLEFVSDLWLIGLAAYANQA